MSPKAPGRDVRRAVAKDFPALRDLEAIAFPPERAASARSLRRSLTSPHQSVWVVDGDAGSVVALLVLWHRPRTLRIYDIAVHPDRRGQGLARTLMAHAEALAARDGAARIVLEASVDEPALVPMYAHLGYEVARRLTDFYGRGRDAVRMEKPLTPTRAPPSPGPRGSPR